MIYPAVSMKTTWKQHQHVGARVVRRAPQKESLSAQKAPLAAADQELVEGGRTADGGGAALTATAPHWNA